MIVKPEQVQAALDFMDGDHAAEIYYRAEMARIEYEEATAAAFVGFVTGSVEDRKARSKLDEHVQERARAWAVAEAEQRRQKTKMDKAKLIGDLYRTESANARERVV